MSEQQTYATFQSNIGLKQRVLDLSHQNISSVSIQYWFKATMRRFCIIWGMHVSIQYWFKATSSVICNKSWEFSFQSNIGLKQRNNVHSMLGIVTFQSNIGLKQPYTKVY